MKTYKKSLIVFILTLFLIFSAFFIHACIEYLDVKQIIPINKISLEKLNKINFKNIKTLKVAIIGDTKEGLQVFYKAAREAKQNGCQFIIHTGDIIRFNDLRIYRYVYNEVKELINEYNIPVFVLPGNHDTWGHHKYSYKNFKKFFGKMPLILNVKNVAFVLINNSNYKFNNRSAKTVENYFKNHNVRLKFLFAHVPTKDPRKNKNHCLTDKNIAKKFEDFIKKNNFNNVFFSHIHSYCTYYIKNIKCYVSGGGGAKLWSNNYHYLQLKINNFKDITVEKENISWLYGLNFIDFIKMRSLEWIPFKTH